MVQEQSNEIRGSTIWTIGHSTRSAEEFYRILKAHKISSLVDVRSFPGSRRLPHFNKQSLSEFLARENVEYHHLPELGGRRRPSSESRNTAWQNPSFRAYADHMETDEFKKGMEQLLRLSEQSPTAIMCAEALWWSCHRGLIADYLKALGVEVIHIRDEKHAEIHPYTRAATLINGELSYAGLLGGQKEQAAGGNS
jgi:uncharacterized protein (DUF488 family)